MKDRTAHVTQRLDPILDALGAGASFDQDGGGLMEGVWERVGAISARRERTIRSILFVGLFAVGLGVGTVTAQAPVYAQETTYQLFGDAHLSPATLLHVTG